MPNCITPGEKDGNMFRCRKCGPCRQTHTDSWVLACMAEAETARESWTVTFTYRPGEDGENFLKYSDVQNLFKRLRKAGHVFRYVVAGELGGQKGRPHWHAIIFWQSAPPARGVVIGRNDAGVERRRWDFWPHGHVVIDDDFAARNVRYVAKYIQKAEDTAGKFQASKRPGIGQDYFDAHAARQAAAKAPWPKNEFTVNGWRASMSPDRWKRYRQMTVEAMALQWPSEWIDWKAYENVMPAEERAEWQAIKAEVGLERALGGVATGFKVHYVKSSPADKRMEYVATYAIGNDLYMRYQLKGSKEWLSGFFLGSDGWFPASPAEDQLRLASVRISPAQMLALKSGKKPKPENDPNIRSDWLTAQAKRLRVGSAKL